MKKRRQNRRVILKVRQTLFVAFVLWCGLSPLFAQTEPAVTVDQVKAAFLYNFIKYTQWPNESAPSDPFHLCVVGQPAVADELARAVDGKLAGGRKVQVVALKDMRKVFDCELLFVGELPEKNEQDLLASTKATPVLTVGESAEFLAGGGLIRFIVEGNRVRFDINVAAAVKGRIRFDSRLLALARSRIEVSR